MSSISITELCNIFTRAASQVPKNLRISVYEFTQELEEAAKQASPIGQGILAGLYKSSWRVVRNSDSSGSISSYSLVNDRPQAVALEVGSVPGEYPWKGTGPRTVVGSNGNIFSSQATEGVVNPLLTDRELDKLAVKVADAVIAGF